MRLTPKHVGMEIQTTLYPTAPWVKLARLTKCRCGIGRDHFWVVGGVYEGFSSEGPWRVKKAKKKTKGDSK